VECFGILVVRFVVRSPLVWNHQAPTSRAKHYWEQTDVASFLTVRVLRMEESASRILLLPKWKNGETRKEEGDYSFCSVSKGTGSSPSSALSDESGLVPGELKSRSTGPESQQSGPLGEVGGDETMLSSWSCFDGE
jgi:hypothetical protein